MSRESSDPAVMNSVAVTGADLVSALEMNRTTGKQVVLRVTPPFSGRMRARLHVEAAEEYDDEPEPVHIEPRQFVEDSLPPYPRPADTEDELRADPDATYTVDRHHEWHRDAVRQWRNAVAHGISDSVSIETPRGLNELSVSVLGEFP